MPKRSPSPPSHDDELHPAKRRPPLRAAAGDDVDVAPAAPHVAPASDVTAWFAFDGALRGARVRAAADPRDAEGEVDEHAARACFGAALRAPGATSPDAALAAAESWAAASAARAAVATVVGAALAAAVAAPTSAHGDAAAPPPEHETVRLLVTLGAADVAGTPRGKPAPTASRAWMVHLLPTPPPRPATTDGPSVGAAAPANAAATGACAASNPLALAALADGVAAVWPSLRVEHKWWRGFAVDAGPGTGPVLRVVGPLGARTAQQVAAAWRRHQKTADGVGARAPGDVPSSALVVAAQMPPRPSVNVGGGRWATP